MDIWEKIIKIPQDKLLHINVCGLVTMVAIVVFKLFGFGRVSCLFGWVVGLVVGVGKEIYDKRKGSFFDIKDIWADLVGNTVVTIYSLFVFGD